MQLQRNTLGKKVLKIDHKFVQTNFKICTECHLNYRRYGVDTVPERDKLKKIALMPVATSLEII